MKRIALSILVLAAAPLFLAGCTNVTYKKSVVTTLDASGKVVSTVITEDITEPHNEPARIPGAQGVELKRITQ